METGERDMFEDERKPAALPQHELPEETDRDGQEFGIPMDDSLSRAPSFSESSQRLLSYLSNASISNLSTSSSSMHMHLLPQEPPLKRMKLETPIQSASDLLAIAGVVVNDTRQQGLPPLAVAGDVVNEGELGGGPAIEHADDSESRAGAITPPKRSEKQQEESSTDKSSVTDPSQKGVVSPDHHGRSSTMPTTGSSLSTSRKLEAPPSPPAPLKATTMSHLRKKYWQELEYMLREFQKLERQLLGAKGPSEESAGSRERREKLHSFIQHLEDTVRQIESGCQLELEGKSTLAAAGDGEDGLAQQESVAPSRLMREKEEEESIQKLEEHILANLLPVKARLTKQLAAQQGAKYNPAGMPHSHHHNRGSTTCSESQGKGTFTGGGATTDHWCKQEPAEAQAPILTTAEQEHTAPVEEDQTQFGKPLEGGSSLTQKLHGQTLGSASRKNGSGVGTAGKRKPERPKLYFAGMAGSSGQINSSVSAANSVHHLVIKNAAVLEMQHKKPEAEVEMPTTTQVLDQPDQVSSLHAMKEICDPSLTDVERHVLHRKRKKKKRLRQEARLQEMQRQRKSALLESQIESVGPAGPKPRKKVVAKGNKKGGPRSVEYMCALCNECYSSQCDDNPWWALSQHECSKCCKMQIPRIDIGAPANAIEYHPALLAHAEDNSSGGGAANAAASAAPIVAAPTKAPSCVVTTTAPTSTVKYDGDLESLGSEISNDDLYLSDDDSLYSVDFDPEAVASMSPSEQAENERFGMEYEGPTLTQSEASRLLILMAHASSCPGRHKSSKHGEACRSTKWMMLHVRDCPGTTSAYDVCPFAWCRKVKHLLFHLVSCAKPQCCDICAPTEIDGNWNTLRDLNDHRLTKFREGLTAQWKSRAISFRSKSLGSERENPASSMHVEADPVGNTTPPAGSPFRHAACHTSEVNSGTTAAEGLDSTTSSFVAKISESSAPSEKSVAAVDDKQQSQKLTTTSGEAEEIQCDTAASIGKDIIDTALFKKDIDEKESNLHDKGCSCEKATCERESELVKDLGTVASTPKARGPSTLKKEATLFKSGGGTDEKDAAKVVPNGCSNLLHTEKAATEAAPNGCRNPLQTPTNAV